ncbi:uncharacterized protein LOC135476436 [Liolophura sinensis]|uniref:uncharacterized protein LOC135476436 n=1 Tax=Liolophura sinensis TaxID=3198878 RepID=UPI003158C2F2
MAATVGLAVAIFLMGFGLAIVHGQHVNTFCILQYCSSEMSACALDRNCKLALACVQDCASNLTCSFGCLNSYDDAEFDAFMKCTATDHDCIQLSPDTPTQCHPPATTLTNFTLEDIKGVWYTVKGYCPASDCFNCQTSTYTIGPQPLQGQVTWKYDVIASDGTLRHLQTVETFIQPDSQNGGILNITRTQFGLDGQEQYRILAFSGDDGYIFVYHCANMGGIVYEGAFVYSRTRTLTSSALSQLMSRAEAYGYNITTFCSPNTSGCTSVE